MPDESLRARILALLQAPGARALNKSELARQLELSSSSRQELRHELASLVEEGLLVMGKKSRYERAAAPPGRLRGNIKFHRKGFAWFFPDALDPGNVATGLDLARLSRIMVERGDAGQALDGDRVLVSLQAGKPSWRDYRGGKRHGSEPPEPHGRVEQVLERRSGKIVGVFRTGKGFGQVETDDAALDVAVRLTAETTARPGQLVVARLDKWDGASASGQVIEVLGWPGEAGVDMRAIIHRNGIRTSFPDDVLEQARAFPAEVDSAEEKQREDWRERFVITIDPADAKDFDDAITVRPTKDGWQLAVHIADVSRYVKPDSPLDKEAAERGNSTYLVDRVIPMLPVELSNGLCSLNPHVDRLTKCVEMEVNQQGRVFKSRFCNAVIRSCARLSYEQAQAMIDGGAAPPGSPAGLAELVREAWKMAAKLRARRFKDGALDLDMPEFRVQLDDHGKAIGVAAVKHTESHQLIEECMLAANESVARILKTRQRPAIYRVHEPPDPGRLDEFADVARAYGYQPGDLSNKAHIQKLLETAKGRPDEHAIKLGLLKSLKRATYSPEPLGHYGLAKTNYCHFTSPIRRYADLVVHRALQPFLDNPPQPLDRTPSQARLAEVAQHISDTERASADAESESQQVKLLEFLESTIGRTPPVHFDGIITEVRPSGLLVEATEIATRGLVKREGLGNAWHMEAYANRASHRSGKELRAGQPVRLEVVRVDREAGFVDFGLAGFTTENASINSVAGSWKNRKNGKVARPTTGGKKGKASPSQKVAKQAEKKTDKGPGRGANDRAKKKSVRKRAR